jgi:GH25 family lysozyme M1 (1,4-beta-N-acetylmuramidase)
MTDIRMADISEWQSDIDAPAYLNGGNSCLICRTYSGQRPDKTMPGRRDYLRKHSFTGLGWYAYLSASSSAASPTDQARAFIQTVGQLRSNEWPILDVEEGSGSQVSRAQAWFDVVDPWAGFPAMLYASDSFLTYQLGGAAHWGNRPIWIAAYPSSYSPEPSREPSQTHLLWQYSNRASFPGLSAGVDASIAHCSAADFIKRCRAGQAPAPAPDTTPAEDDAEPFVVVKQDGRLEAFVYTAQGEVKHAWQTAPNAGWAGSEPGKTATWYSLGKPGK